MIFDLEPMREEVLSMLKESCYRKGEYKLSSGKMSPHYVNCKPLTLHGKGLCYVSFLLLNFIEQDTVAVGGLTLGADPLVSGVAMAAALNEEIINGLIVRKEPKGHGTEAWIEGPLPEKGSRVTVLEDVVTTGASAIKAALKLRDAGYVVERVVAIVDRQEELEIDEAMQKEGLELYSLFDLQELL